MKDTVFTHTSTSAASLAVPTLPRVFLAPIFVLQAHTHTCRVSPTDNTYIHALILLLMVVLTASYSGRTLRWQVALSYAIVM
jgi:hypothetical protein